jgi:SAM-dependent methyltransferase
LSARSYPARAFCRAIDLRNMALEGLLAERPRIDVYEAGGGSATRLPAGVRARARYTVVDLSPEQIEKCDYADEKAVGDCTVWRRPDSFDLVVAHHLLEHVPDVQAALENFAVSLRPGGIIAITSPRKNGLQGLVTRLTPHAFHVWYYRRMGWPNAGKPGHQPFPVHFAPGLTREEMQAFADRAGLELLFFIEYVGTHDHMLAERRPLLHRVYAATCRALRALSLGGYEARHSDFTALMRKPA